MQRTDTVILSYVPVEYKYL